MNSKVQTTPCGFVTAAFRKRFLITLAVTAVTSASTLRAADASAVADPAPFLPVPNPAQLRWHKAENIMLVCWGMKTYYPNDNHMGTGTEDPKMLNPTKLDPAQWARVAREAGFKGIIFTTKHHDGFCIWQTATTGHSMKSVAWENGKGDVVKELIGACRKEGLYFGLYVSLRDNHYEAEKSKDYVGYDDYYYTQLKELSTHYGPIDEYWFDGFTASKVGINYARLADLIRQEQPEAVVYDSATLVKFLPDRCLAWPGHHGTVSPDPNYRRMIDGKLCWYPEEASLILQGNWFHNGTPAVSVEAMKNYYIGTVGNGVTPLMNVAPNKDGLMDEDTIQKLHAFKAWVDTLNANDLARLPGIKTTGSAARGGEARFAPEQATDGNSDTYFATDDGATNATLEVAFDKPRKVDGFILQEPIALGQRVTDFSLECKVQGQWVPVFSGKTIGYKRIILEGYATATEMQFSEGNIDINKALKDKATNKPGKVKLPVAEGVRLKINNSLACPLISTFQIVGG